MISVRQLRQVGPRPGDAVPGKCRTANAKQFRTLVVRASTLGHTPEGSLWASVLALAWSEARTPGHVGCRSFFSKGTAQRIADAIGYPGDIAQVFRDHHPSYSCHD